jgi:hypothetical protein
MFFAAARRAACTATLVAAILVSGVVTSAEPSNGGHARDDELAAGCRVPRFPVQLGGIWGYIDRRGRVVIKPRYDHAFAFSDGLAAVTEDGKVAFVNDAGRVIIPFGAVPSIGTFSEGRAAIPFSTDSGFRWGFVDETGRVSIVPVYDKVSDFSDGFARVQGADGRVGFIDKMGTVKIPLKYLAANDFSDGLAEVSTKTGWGFVDRSGHMIIRPRFAAAKRFSEGLAPVEIGDRWGFIDRHGTIAVSPQFEEVEPFSEGVAAVKSGTWGFINKAGRFTVEPSFFAVRPFSDGRSLVSRVGFSDLKFNSTLNANAGYIDSTGSLAIPYRFDQALSFVCGWRT